MISPQLCFESLVGLITWNMGDDFVPTRALVASNLGLAEPIKRIDRLFGWFPENAHSAVEIDSS
jgi:hypothetical protein